MTASLLAGWLASVASADTSSRELPAPGEDEKLYSCKKSTGSIEITFKPETEVKDLVTWVMGFTCKNFIYAPHIVAQGRKLTIVAPTKMTAQEAYRLFLASLATLNLTVVPQGNIMKIIETNTGKRLPVPLFKSGTPDNTDQLVRYVLRPNYMQADALAKAIGSVKSDPGEITVAGSLLLIVDYGSHVRDMLSIARLVDVPSGSEGVYTLALKHADAAKLLPKLTSILGMEGAAAAGKAAPAPTNEMQAQGVAPSKILVDERTNTLIVAASPAAYERVKALVERLDISLEIEGGSSIHVYPLGSAIAEEVAKTLNEAIQKTQVPSGSTTPARQGSPLPSSSTAGLGEGLDGRAQVVADKPTNKLIVVSSGRDFLAIKEVIKELDQPRRQVYIEALILEVNMSNDRSFGFSVHGGKTVGSTGSTLALGGVQTGSVSSVDPTSLVGATGLVGGLIGSALPGSSDLFGQSIPSFGVLMQAIAHRSNTNILSAPSIIALDNEEAKYKVGTNIPYSKGIIPTTTVTQNSPVSTNVDRKDLVLELKIKPHISTGDQILLEIVHEANDFGEDLALGPSWATRGFETRAVVKDQQTFVLGGLMQEKDIYTSEQVPILGDIPLLGHLFKFSKKTKKKTNLIIMLTPYIIKDDLELEAIRERKMREHQEYTQSQRTFAELRYQPRIDYRRKRGLLEDINRTVEQVEKDLEQLADLRRPEPMKSGPVQVPAQVEGAE
ncbi:MAG: type II secretion system secretin GspD [Kofleriaceae bacterium]